MDRIKINNGLALSLRIQWQKVSIRELVTVLDEKICLSLVGVCPNPNPTYLLLVGKYNGCGCGFGVAGGINGFSSLLNSKCALQN